MFAPARADTLESAASDPDTLRDIGKLAEAMMKVKSEKEKRTLQKLGLQKMAPMRFGPGTRGEMCPFFMSGSCEHSRESCSRAHDVEDLEGLHFGMWLCPSCMMVNFAHRAHCHRKTCGLENPNDETSDLTYVIRKNWKDRQSEEGLCTKTNKDYKTKLCQEHFRGRCPMHDVNDPSVADDCFDAHSVNELRGCPDGSWCCMREACFIVNYKDTDFCTRFVSVHNIHRSSHHFFLAKFSHCRQKM